MSARQVGAVTAGAAGGAAPGAVYEQDRIDELVADLDLDGPVGELLETAPTWRSRWTAGMPEIGADDEILDEMRSLCAVYPVDRHREVVEEFGQAPGDNLGQKLSGLITIADRRYTVTKMHKRINQTLAVGTATVLSLGAATGPVGATNARVTSAPSAATCSSAPSTTTSSSAGWAATSWSRWKGNDVLRGNRGNDALPGTSGREHQRPRPAQRRAGRRSLLG